MGILFAALLVVAIIPAFMASKKGRNWLVWYIYGVFLFLFAMIHVIVLKPNEHARGMKRCPKCASVVSEEATVCPSCRSEFGVESASAQPESKELQTVQSIEPETPQAIADQFAGERNIASSEYQLFLVKRFGIEKNPTLEKYVIGNHVFATLEDSLRNADAQYEKEVLIHREKVEMFQRESQRLELKALEEKARQESEDTIALADKTRRQIADLATHEMSAKRIKRVLIPSVILLAVLASWLGYVKNEGSKTAALAAAEIQRKDAFEKAAKVNQAAQELIDFARTGRIFGYKTGEQNLLKVTQLLDKKAHCTFGRCELFCNANDCRLSVGNSSITPAVTAISFVYCLPGSRGNEDVVESNISQWVLTEINVNLITSSSLSPELQRGLIKTGALEPDLTAAVLIDVEDVLSRGGVPNMTSFPNLIDPNVFQYISVGSGIVTGMPGFIKVKSQKSSSGLSGNLCKD